MEVRTGKMKHACMTERNITIIASAQVAHYVAGNDTNHILVHFLGVYAMQALALDI